MDADLFASALGWMGLVGEGGVLARVLFGFATERAAWEELDRVGAGGCRVRRWHPQLAERLLELSCGQRHSFDDVELDLHTYTPFARDVLRACRRIRWGATQTYGELAAACGAPGAARAVGNVMAANRFPLVVPCHRVVAANGRLGGFSARDGVAMKKRLLRLERQQAVG
jgi:methylated-DNA-[protein]-cysteine S-methyltransferase